MPRNRDLRATPPRVELPDFSVVPPAFEPNDEDESPEIVDPDRETGDIDALSDASFRDWTWQVYRLRTPDEMRAGPKATPRLWICKLVGPVDLTSFQRDYGGGSFQFYGYFNGHLRKRVSIDLDGPPKTRPAEPTLAPPPVAGPAVGAAPASQDPALVQLLQKQLEYLQRLDARLSQQLTPASQAFSIKDVLSIVELVRGGASPDSGVVKEMVGLIQEGIKLGQSRGEGGGENNVLGTVLEKLVPLGERIVERMGTRRPGPPRPPGAPASGAAVVEPTPAAPAPSRDDAEAARHVALVDALARAVADRLDPVDFAATVENLLTPQEVALLRLTTTDALMADLEQQATNRYPILATPDARAFVDAVLNELRTPPSDEPAPA